MRQAGDVEEFTKQLLRAAAKLGATGYINYQKAASESADQFRGVGRTLPVYVAADTARALAVCRAQPKGRGGAEHDPSAESRSARRARSR